MRTTLDIDDDVLQAAQELARREKKSVDAVISELARRALTAPLDTATALVPKAAYRLRPFPKRGGVVTTDLIDRLREDDVY